MSAPKKKRSLRRLRAVTAIVTAGVIVVGSAVAWLAGGGIERAQAGTLSSLAENGQAGGWRTVDARELDVSGTDTQPVLGGFDEGGDAADAPSSWVVQLTATAGGAEEGTAEARVSAEGQGATLLVVPAGETASVTTIVTVTDDAVRLRSEGILDLEATAIASFVPPADGGVPDAGGSIATAPFVLADTDEETGFSLEQLLSGAVLSPLGLGGIPTDGVATVWVQVVATGDAPEIRFGENDDAGAVLEDTGGIAQGLVPLSLDDGAFRIRASAGTSSLSLVTVGWVAAPATDSDRAVIDSGLVAAVDLDGTATDGVIAAPPVAPNGLLSLYAVQLSAADTVRVGTSDAAVDGLGVAPTGVDIAGQASTLVVAADGDRIFDAVDSAARISWLGYFAGESDAASASRIAIETPAQDASVDLVETNGQVVFSGTVTGDAGVASVHLKNGNRYIGSARTWLTNEGHRWEFATNAPVGAHTVTAVLTDLRGAQTEASVSFDVEAVAETDTIVAPNVVVIGQDDLPHVESVTDSRIVFSSVTPVQPGDIFSLAPGEGHPDGVLRKATAVQWSQGMQVISTTSAVLTDAILNTHVLPQDIAVTTASDPDELRVPEESDYATGVGEGDTQAAPSAGGFGGGTSLASMADDLIDVENTGYADSLEMTYGLNFGDTLKDDGSVSGSVDASLKWGVPNSQTTTEVKVPLPMTLSVPEDADQIGDDSGADDAVKGTSKGSLSVSGSVKQTVTVFAYAHIELKIARGDVWRAFLPRVDVIQYDLTFVETKTVEANVSTALKATFGVEREKSRSWTNGDLAVDAMSKTTDLRIRLGAVVVPTPVPIYLSAYLIPELSVTFELKAALTWKKVSTEVRTVGLRWDHGSLTPVSEHRVVREPSKSMDVAITASIGIDLDVYVEVRIYEAAGVFLGVLVDATFSAKVATKITEEGNDPVTLTLAFALGVQGVAGIRLDVFGQEVFKKQVVVTLLDDDPPLWKEEVVLDEGGAVPDELKNADEEQSAVSTGERPLALIIDVSGSMAGERIERAKETLSEIISQQQPGAEIGIWTYPGNDSCSPGGFQVPLESHAGTGALLDVLQGLETGGGTPTGEALQVAANQLIAQGRTGATLLLVSDGESNCEVPPCEVVSDIRDLGFDLAVTTVAFEISEAGREELECIAKASGSESYEVENEEDLLPLIEELSLAKVEPAIVNRSGTRAGDTVRVEVRIDNPSARDATGIRFAVSVAGDENAVISPAEGIVGNIPQGGSVTRTVEVQSSLDAGEVELTLQTWGANVPAAAAESAFTVYDADAAMPLPDPGPVIAEVAQAEPQLLVAGDTSLTVGSADAADGCRAGGAIPSFGGVEWAEATVVPCDREANESIPEAAEATHIAVQYGGDDIGLPDLLAACLDGDCEANSSQMENAYRAAQEVNIDDRLDALWAQANEGRDAAEAAPLYVVPYPLLFPENRGRICTATVDADAAESMNALVRFLNASLSAAVDRARERGIEAYYLDGVETAFQSGGSLCDESPGAEIVRTDDGAQVLLTPSGAERVASSAAEWSEGREREIPEESWQGETPAVAESLAVPLGLVVDAPQMSFGIDEIVTATGPAAITGTVVKPGQTLRITGQGYDPESTVYVSLRTERTTIIGHGVALADGSLSIDAVIPAGETAGGAAIAVLGTNERGEGFRSIMDLGIGSSTPWWILGLLGIVLLAGAVTVFAVIRVRMLR